MKFAKVVLLKKLGEFDEPLTYIVPDSVSCLLKIGNFVKVPFRSKYANGIVSDISEMTDVSLDKLKELSEIIPSISILPEHVRSAEMISVYYKTSIAKALRLFLPARIWNGILKPPAEDHYEISVVSDMTAKQQVFFDFIVNSGGRIKSDALKNMGFSHAVISALIKKGCISKKSYPVFTGSSSSEIRVACKTLTPEQQSAFEIIRKSDKPVLLYGVTGSGKTEIYLREIIETVKSGKQAILLLPEIALTPQMTDYFRGYFGDGIAVFHSKMTDGKRSEEWWKAYSGNANLVIGSRSAIFAPLHKLGLIILDEEHEWTYKQESSPYYETHRIAEMFADTMGVKLIFGSATPRAETFQKAINGQYDLATLKSRINDAGLPKIHVVDLRDEFKKKNFSIFSLLLKKKISERLDLGEQIILFVNQRGLANAVVCRDCGYTEKCPNCDISLKLHDYSGFQGPSQKLICHYCNYSKEPSLMCPGCGSQYIKNVGIGTQRVEQEIKKLFPQARVLRADSDTAKNEDDFPKIYRDFSERKADILIGTQMISKGLDFDGVSLIGIILADVGLHMPDFRSSERLFQILTQVSGRCGRRDREGEVVLQTYNPGNPTLLKAANHDYDGFISDELKIRRKLSYPPFSKILKFTVTGEDRKKLSEHIKKEKEILEDIFTVNNLNLKIISAPALIPKVSNRYYFNVLIRSDNPSLIFSHWKPPRGWRIDVDPVHTV